MGLTKGTIAQRDIRQRLGTFRVVWPLVRLTLENRFFTSFWFLASGSVFSRFLTAPVGSSGRGRDNNTNAPIWGTAQIALRPEVELRLLFWLWRRGFLLTDLNKDPHPQPFYIELHTTRVIEILWDIASRLQEKWEEASKADYEAGVHP